MIEPKTQREKDCYTKGYRDAEKAYGGCHFCYGKGYSSQQVVENMLPRTVVTPCSCERGKQIEGLLGGALPPLKV